MDYRKFLSRPEDIVLPYFGGVRVEDRQRRLRLVGDAAPGWWSFAIEGRRARPIAKAEPVDLSSLAPVRGHFAAEWLFIGGGEIERIALPPPCEPEPLAPCTARRWYGGELLLDSIDFEDEAEERARGALERGESLAQIKGVAPSLRAAFGFALVAIAARAAGVPVSPREAAPRVHAIAAGGRAAADQLVAEIIAERGRLIAARERDAARRQLDAAVAAARPITLAQRHRDPGDRADAALAAVGARMLRYRRLDDRRIEVGYNFMGERFTSVVDANTLQVYDAGICLDGADSDLTLESLPSAIREAIETGELCITRH